MSGARRALSPNGNVDFHAYWYAGEHLRQRRNPYIAHQNAVYVEPPLTNIDSNDLRWTVSYEGKSFTPANTAPLLLAIAPLSYFAWPNAQIIWLIINLLCAVLIPFLSVRVCDFQELDFPKRFFRVVIPLFFWTLAATRLTLTLGQTSLVVLTLLLLALKAAQLDYRALSAALLALALSKYSLALPIFLYFVLHRQWKIILGSLLIQLAGLLLLCGLTHSSPIETLLAYIDLLRVHVGQAGIHFAALLPDGMFWRAFGAISVTLPTIFATLRHEQNDLALLATLSVWTLLVAYHRAYDAVLLIFPFLYLLNLYLRKPSNRFIYALAAGICLSLIVSYPPATTISLLLLLGWLFLVPSSTPVAVS